MQYGEGHIGGGGESRDRGLEIGLKRFILSESRAMVGLADMKTSLGGRKFSSCKPEEIENEEKTCLVTWRKIGKEDSPRLSLSPFFPRFFHCPSDD